MKFDMNVGGATQRNAVFRTDLAEGASADASRPGLPNTLAVPDALLRTARFSPEEQEAHEVTGKKGKPAMRASGDVIKTEDISDLNFRRQPVPTGVALLVHLPGGNRLISTGNDNTGFVPTRKLQILPRAIKHSTLGDGKWADGFEMGTTKKGTIHKLTNKSGHYQPDLEGFRGMLRALNANGIKADKAKFYLKLFPGHRAGGTRGYKSVDNTSVRALAGSLMLGKFEGMEPGTLNTYRFHLGSITAKPGADGKIAMAQTPVGHIPGKVLRQAGKLGYGSFHETVVHPDGTLEFRFNAKDPKAPPTEQALAVTLKPDELKKYGLAIDADRLPALAKK